MANSSDKAYRKKSYVVAAIVTTAGAFLLCEGLMTTLSFNVTPFSFVVVFISVFLILSVIALSWMLTRLKGSNREIMIILFGVFFTIVFTIGGYLIHQKQDNYTSSLSTETEENETIGIAVAEEGDDELSTDIVPEVENDVSLGEDNENAQFAGLGEEGLIGSLPEGTTNFVGDMAGYPIEFNITKNSSTGELSAKYRNVKFNAKMNFTGESLPAMGGDIDFYSTDSQGNLWLFSLTGDYNTIIGKGIGDGQELQINLRRKP